MLYPVNSLTIFPTLIQEYDLREYYDKDDIIEFLYSEIKNGDAKASYGLFDNTVSSYNYKNNFFQNEYSTLLKKIMSCINLYAKEAGFKQQKPANSWFNIGTYGADVKPHKHRDVNIASTFYPLFSKGSSNLILHRPIQENLIPENQFIKSHCGKDTAYNNEKYELKIKEGHLYVWPAWLIHSAEPNTTGERVTIALNTINK